MEKKSTAKLIKPLLNYKNEVGLYKLSKGVKLGKKTYTNVVVARGNGLSGKSKVTVWLADDVGTIVSSKPYTAFGNLDIALVFEAMGYKLI